MQRKNIPLFVGIALPIVFVFILSTVIFLPSVFVKPQYDFIYTVDDRYADQALASSVYEVRDRQIHVRQTSATTTTGDLPIIYYYDVADNTSRQISYQDAKSLILDPGPSSPDGYNINYEYSHDGIFELFGDDSDDSGYYISKGSGKKMLSGIGSGNISSWYNNNLALIGWVR